MIRALLFLLLSLPVMAQEAPPCSCSWVGNSWVAEGRLFEVKPRYIFLRDGVVTGELTSKDDAKLLEVAPELRDVVESWTRMRTTVPLPPASEFEALAVRGRAALEKLK